MILSSVFCQAAFVGVSWSVADGARVQNSIDVRLALATKSNTTDYPQSRCCCFDGDCKTRNAIREGKREILIPRDPADQYHQGGDYKMCCKPRHEDNWVAGQCDAIKYHQALTSLINDQTLYDNLCHRQCYRHKDCNGHGESKAVLYGLTEVCECTCDKGHDPASNCDKCLAGFEKFDGQGSCLEHCTNDDVDCNGHGTATGLKGHCGCHCEPAYDDATNCSTCANTHMMVDNSCVELCTERHITCKFHQVATGHVGQCSCGCKDGFDPDSECQKCTGDRVLTIDGGTCIDVSLLEAHELPSVSVEGYDVGGYAKIYWVGYYETACEAHCGQSYKKLIAKDCKVENSQGAEKDREWCQRAVQPERFMKCTSLDLCEFVVDQPPEDNCGWGSVRCKHRENHKVEPSHYCEEKFNISEGEWQRTHAIHYEGCPAKPFNSLCAVTVNMPDDKSVEKKVNAMVTHCKKDQEDADIITVATQEMSGWTLGISAYNFFSKLNDFFVKHDYVSPAGCSSKVSAGAAVFVKKHRRDRFEPRLSECEKPIEQNDGSSTNMKGSTIVESLSILGKLVVASTHGDRGSWESESRIELFQQTVQRLLAVNDTAFTVWGGDFNVRTPLESSDVQELLKHGYEKDPNSTDAAEGKEAEWGSEYDPVKVFELLKEMPDPLGRREKNLDKEIEEASDGKLQQVDGIKNLCPTYRKEPHSGKSKRQGLTGSKWAGSLACKVNEDAKVEYYNCCKYGQDDKKSRAPSWTERIFVSKNLKEKCSEAKKIVSEADHDMLYVSCELPELKK